MNRKKYITRLQSLLYALEFAMAVTIIIGIVTSVPDLFKYMVDIAHSTKGSSYELFQSFLSHVLLMVIGLEFVAMLINHEEYQIIYIMIMVVARKMLIYGDNTQDLFIGVLAIAVLFIVRKYFTIHKILANAGVAFFDAQTRMEKVNEHLVRDIESREEILGDYIQKIFDEQDKIVELGAVVEDERYVYQVEEMDEGRMTMIALEDKYKGM
ncbi:phosphate-starvation-inducible PsiE family protein [Aedoeadaptatus acetigenes]|uniref:phosphate-starvation-inducible PsiE family protein n=1 Tax=Aedoeadaptatus acetigenes TaxID=2981723 RepID=UPI0011DD34F9|nr:phosphate-starvation-inducible PsiE family protein [Aedoeadaptatus acetigenes]MCU6785933.1 phosphate-starvation-inducible PsiE family protein [Aedoeadaptatus acetigenes]